jgi:hypothetical protein
MVGSVVATKDAVIPATVGVDIGCGTAAIKTPFKSSILENSTRLEGESYEQFIERAGTNPLNKAFNLRA